ncbi:MAG: MgtC/SapB family protein [archaeon]
MFVVFVISEFDLILRMLLALAFGAVIGFEREKEEEPAGFRTHMLICLGATLFTVLSMDFPGTSDPSRIAAGLVTGIGFLGAGAIFRAENKIRGLTTAADLWVLTAVGIAIGIGYFVAAAASTVAVLAILYLKRFLHKSPQQTL